MPLLVKPNMFDFFIIFLMFEQTGITDDGGGNYLNALPIMELPIR